MPERQTSPDEVSLDSVDPSTVDTSTSTSPEAVPPEHDPATGHEAEHEADRVTEVMPRDTDDIDDDAPTVLIPADRAPVQETARPRRGRRRALVITGAVVVLLAALYVADLVLSAERCRAGSRSPARTSAACAAPTRSSGCGPRSSRARAVRSRWRLGT